jgi:hypothetical protein
MKFPQPTNRFVVPIEKVGKLVLVWFFGCLCFIGGTIFQRFADPTPGTVALIVIIQLLVVGLEVIQIVWKANGKDAVRAS